MKFRGNLALRKLQYLNSLYVLDFKAIYLAGTLSPSLVSNSLWVYCLWVQRWQVMEEKILLVSSSILLNYEWCSAVTESAPILLFGSWFNEFSQCSRWPSPSLGSCGFFTFHNTSCPNWFASCLLFSGQPHSSWAFHFLLSASLSIPDTLSSSYFDPSFDCHFAKEAKWDFLNFFF